MSQKYFERRTKEKLPVLAICYDFDRTLSPDDMQAQGFIQAVGWATEAFWKDTNRIAQENDMDTNLAYMWKMVDGARGRFKLTKQVLMDYGAKVKLFPGVADWFERIRAYGKEKGVIVEHYIISSGIREMIEGTVMGRAGAFEAIYASSFFFNEDGEAVWPAQAVNYTNKTQFLFRIEKGVLDVNDQAVNDTFPPEQLRVPWRNMLYIGDSDTDVPCMRLVNSYGGYAIGVYDEEAGSRRKVYKMLREDRIKYFVPANYGPGSEMERLLQNIIDRTAVNEELEGFHYLLKKEMESFAEKENSRTTPEEREKEKLIAALSVSGSFATTHMLISRLSAFSDWTPEERERLLAVAENNKQVYYMLSEAQTAAFYRRLLAQEDASSLTAQSIREALSSPEII